MPELTRAPLVDLQPGGTPAIISYQVPEPMSFSGRNYIDLALPASAFPVVQPTSGPAAAGGEPHALRDDAAPSEVLEALHDAQAAPSLQLPAPAVGGHDDGAEDRAAAVLAPGKPVTDRLAALTCREVRALAAAGQRVIVHEAVGGLLDFRVVPAPSAPVSARSGLAAGMTTQQPSGGGIDDEPISWQPSLHVSIQTPQMGGSPMTGPAAGTVIKVCGSWRATRVVGAPNLAVTLNGQPVGPASLNAVARTFTVDVPVAQSGAHTITVTATNGTYNSDGEPVTLTATAEVSIGVELDPDAGGAPITPPVVTLTAPTDRTLLLSQQGSVQVTVRGSAQAGAGTSVATVAVSDGANTAVATPDPDGNWTVNMLLSGTGAHTIRAVATDATGLSGTSVSVSVTVSDQQPFRRLLNRLLIVETLNLSSFLGNFGAGRVLKTYSLLPGESASISVKSYTRTTRRGRTRRASSTPTPPTARAPSKTACRRNSRTPRR